MDALEAFENALNRADHLVCVYDLLYNKRERRVRPEKTAKIIEAAGWNKSDNLCVVENEFCLLAIRGDEGWEMQHFEHEYLAELLRAAFVMTVSALDRYLHIVVYNSTDKWFQYTSENIPSSVSDFSIPFEIAEKCIKQALVSRDGEAAKKTRPRTILKNGIRELLYKETFQSARGVEYAFNLMGFKQPWKVISDEMKLEVKVVRGNLNQIATRRNQIVHEGDIRNIDRPRAVETNEISMEYVRNTMEWIRKFVGAIEKGVNA